MATIDRMVGYSASAALKVPCVVAATSNITLSGEQTIAGVAVTAGQRVLAAAQTDATKRLIWIASTGAWEMAPDFDGARDVVDGTQVLAGTSDPGAWQYWLARSSDDPIVPGTSSITWEQHDYQDLAIRADQANSSDPTKGAGMDGYNALLAYIALTTGAGLRDFGVSIGQMPGADGTGVADQTANLVAALATGRPVYVPSGTWKVSAIVMSTQGQRLYGCGQASILLATDAALNLITVQADYVAITDLRMNGVASSDTNNTFAVYTEAASPARSLSVERVLFSGASAGVGFNNAVKFDDGCNRSNMIDCEVERLWGNVSGRGYGCLIGNASDCVVMINRMTGTAGRGRHGVYLTAGASNNLVIGNVIRAFDYDGIPIFSQGAQPSCNDNIVELNELVSTPVQANVNFSAISVFGHAARNKVRRNAIISSASCGIKLDGTGVTDLYDTQVEGNTITAAGFIGVDIISAVRGRLAGNDVFDSSGSSAGTYANVRLSSDTVTAASDWLLSGNNTRGARSGLQLNATAPTPTGIRERGNHWGAGSTAAIELLGGNLVVDQPRRVVTITYGASMTPAAGDGDRHTITATNTTAFTINAPTLPVAGYSLTLTIRNASGGALGAITWNAVFKMAAWTSPANGFSRSITFKYDGTNWVEESRASADVPN